MEGADAFRSLKCMLGDHVLRIESSINDQNKLVKLLPAPSSRIADGCNSKNMIQSKKESVISTMNKLAKGKLSLGAKILQVGGVEKVFRRIFTVSEGEKLLKASQCRLFTTAGALTGRLFISTENLAFCSDKAVAKYSSPSGETCRYHYKSAKCTLEDHVLRHQHKPMKLLTAPSSHNVDGLNSKIMKKGKKESVISAMNKLAKEKLSLGGKILSIGRVGKEFRQMFNLNEGEQLLKASQCSLFTTAGQLTGRLFVSTDKIAFCSDKAIAKYSSPSGETLRYHYKVVIPLSKIKKANQIEDMKKASKKYLQVVTDDEFEFCLYTTAGPIVGRLFISSEKLAFCSDKPIAKVSSPAGEPLRFHYKVVIPLRKINKINQSENLKKPSQKYLEIVTADEFEFWFMGFRSYNKTLKFLQQAVSQSLIC
uniref:GRAM domain-containing protein n=1 Tax=Chenopodium quinoa TaxID=63459 RepID=A0A803LS06_CHEQI